jgi:group I intron endonuclease
MNTYIDFPNTPPFGYGFIYFLRSPSGRAYIGQTTVSISKRLYMHNKSRGCRFLYAAIKKYGIENFFAGEVGCYPLADLDAMEVRFIKEFETLAPDGYNLTTGGYGNHKCSDETRQRMSEATKGRPKSPETRQRMSEAMKGKPKSAETRQRMSAAKKGVPKSPEAIQKMVEAHKRCPTILSAAARKRISEAKKGKPKSEETRKRMSKPKSAEARKNMSKPKSAEARKRMSDAWKGKPKSEETKRRMSEGWRLKKLREQDPLPLFQNL